MLSLKTLFWNRSDLRNGPYLLTKWQLVVLTELTSGSFCKWNGSWFVDESAGQLWPWAKFLWLSLISLRGQRAGHLGIGVLFHISARDVAYLQCSPAATGLAWQRGHLYLLGSLAKGALIYVYTIPGLKNVNHFPTSLKSLQGLSPYVLIDLCAIDSLLGLVTSQFLLWFSNFAC